MSMRSTVCGWLTLALLVAQPAAPQTARNLEVMSAGHHIAVHVIPGRAPAVLLDAGGGLDSSYWADLAPKLAKATGSEVITYDRAGVGASDYVPGPWSLAAARDDLTRVLESLDATHDVILVSHSLAGEIALSIATAHPGWFAGAVLVDANVPEFFTPAMIESQLRTYAPMIAALRKAPPTPQTRQLIDVSDSFAETSRTFHKARWPRSLPLIVIVSEKTPFDEPALAANWKSAHASLAHAAANRQLVTARGSSHDVAHDRPDVILAATLAMVRRQSHRRRA